MRRRDSMQRDASLADWHAHHGVSYPAAGMTLPFIEYDMGVPVGLVSYHAPSDQLPTGVDARAAHAALASILLPFVSVVYTPETWTYYVIGHNEAGRALTGHQDWRGLDEAGFASVLYAMRGRERADLSRFGVTWGAPSVVPDRPERFPGEFMSARRRSFEPEMDAPSRRLIPCTDIDLMVPAKRPSGRPCVGLVVDYKHDGARVNLKSPSLAAMASLPDSTGGMVPALVVRYESDHEGYRFSVAALNRAGSDLLEGSSPGWMDLNETGWLDVLDRAEGDL